MTTPLTELLDECHAALRVADFARLPALTAALEAAEADPDTAVQDLAALAARASRNISCLDAAAQGLRAARRRLAEIRDARAGLATYNGTGTRHILGASGHALVRRL